MLGGRIGHFGERVELLWEMIEECQQSVSPMLVIKSHMRKVTAELRDTKSLSRLEFNDLAHHEYYTSMVYMKTVNCVVERSLINQEQRMLSRLWASPRSALPPPQPISGQCSAYSAAPSSLGSFLSPTQPVQMLIPPLYPLFLFGLLHPHLPSLNISHTYVSEFECLH